MSSSRVRGRIWLVVRRMPLSLAYAVGITILAVMTGALSGGTPVSTIDRFGYSLDHLEAGHLYVLPVSDWLVVGTRHWASMLLLTALFVAPLEWLAGTGVLARVFVVGSWLGTILTSLAVRLLGASLNWRPQPDLLHEADVGGSVGAWAAAGALNVIVGGRWPLVAWPLRVGSAIYLGHLLWAEHGTADVAHALGFCIGTAIGVWGVRSAGSA